MPKRTLYLKDEEDALYEKVKELTVATGETIGGVFVKALKDYIDEKERELQGFKLIKLFIGESDSIFGESGEEIEFTGKLIGSGTRQEDVEVTETLYRTLKKKFLLHISYFDRVGMSQRTKYRIIETVEELKGVQLAPEIFNALQKGDIITRRLDI